MWTWWSSPRPRVLLVCTLVLFTEIFLFIVHGVFKAILKLLKLHPKAMRSQTLSLSSSTLFLIVMCLCFFLSSSRNSNFLHRGSSLSVEDHDSDLLISPDNTFTCGFYGAGENAYYFSIWFTNSKDKTVVWMANREKPVSGKGSRISLLRNGAFILADIDGSTRWETNTTTTDVRRAELLDNGNLVLKNLSGKILWQSFDFPTDTLLPYQLFTESKKLISRLGRGNYAAGNFIFFFDNDNVLRLMYDGIDISSVYWPNVNFDVFQNGRFNYNSTRIAVLDDIGRFSSSDELEFNASDSGFGVKRRLTMDYDGNLRLYSLNSGTGLWTIIWQAVMQICSIHGICGRNGICVYQPEPKCSCPPGYEMADPSNWNKGCKPMFSRFCSQPRMQAKFVKLQHVDFFGFDSSYSIPISFESCKNKCLEDCQCQAFMYRLSGQGACYTKAELFNGFKSPNFPGNIFLKLPSSLETSDPIILQGTNYKCNSSVFTKTIETSSIYGARGKSVRWVYLYSFASVIGAMEMLFIVLGWWLLFRKHGLPALMEEGYRVICSQFRKFTYIELKKATKNFKEELGKGASGSVYKGVLADERAVAIKKLGDAYQIEEAFWAEVCIIGKINHMNLVRMWGFCSEPKHRLLVYEYVENKSLDRHLFSGNNFLGWKERFKVALGTAKGLAYLHHECLEWVIHCDVKPENILLDGEFNPKISDFGLAKLSQRSHKNFEFSRIRGTKGYMAPEWALNLPITAKVDVYSYGVVILELVKGLRLSNWVEDGEEHETELMRFVRLVKRKIRSEEPVWTEDAADTRLNGEFSKSQAEKMVEIGISCVEEDRSKRPTMDSIVQALLECEDGVRVQTPENPTPSSI